MKIKFKEIATFTPGQSPESKYYSSSEGFPFLQGNRTFGLLRPTIDTYTKKVTKIAHNGEILMSVRAPVGDLNFANQDICIGRGLAAINSKYGDNNFLFYALKYNIKNVIRQSNGTTFGSITRDVVENMDMIIPDKIESYSKISQILSNIDSKISLNNEIESKLKSLATIVYNYWFNQFEFPNEEGKPYKSSGGKMIWNEKLKRKIPEGWACSKIGDCIKHINTGLNPRDNFVLNNGDIKYITVKNLTKEGNLNFDGCDTISSSTKEMINRRSMISKGDILFASIAPLGRCFFIQSDPTNWEINESVFSIRPDLNKVCPEYLYQFLISDYFVKKAEHSSTGSIFSGIRVSTLQSIPMLLPDRSVIDNYQKIVKDLFKYSDVLNNENLKLFSLRDFLLPLLMNGQATFSD